ncbi:hypothetical protein Hoch_3963 [Haliangium ochraceum DSM 14365]|uniref:Uncharacterized protein n=2 Tax=Haliangium ochraceum TaxID=80816 RepID=D0LI83_HALO1|nr:hypothetical protein Hoch_3963 [Haliangium ochraceum DSM 14365]
MGAGAAVLLALLLAWPAGFSWHSQDPDAGDSDAPAALLVGGSGSPSSLHITWVQDAEAQRKKRNRRRARRNRNRRAKQRQQQQQQREAQQEQQATEAAEGEAQAASAAGGSGKNKRPARAAQDGGRSNGDGDKVFDFTGINIAGQLRAPQLLYFLDRAAEELDRASLERRSFIPELVRSIDEESL